MLEVRFHGRGGQGAVTSAELMAQAAINEGKYAQAFPAFGPERRGAPVLAFLRTSDNEPVRIRSGITEPDVVLVLDPTLLRIVDVTSGLKEGGFLIFNTQKPADKLWQQYSGKWKIATVDATKIAKEVLKLAVTNTTMIGALLKVTEAVKIDSLLPPLIHRFGRAGGERNFTSLKRAYEETIIKGA